MAADEELSLSWCFVCEEILSDMSTDEGFFGALKIWIERPQVLNRRLVGSFVIESFFTEKANDILALVIANMTRNGSISRDDLLGLAKRKVKEGDEGVVEVKIRSLIPRESSRHSNVLEMIIQDKHDKSATFLPFEENQATNNLRCDLEHAYQVTFLETQNNQSLSLCVADKRTKGNGITCPTVEWLKSCLIPKLHKWMSEDNATSSLGESLRLVSVEKYSRKYEELKKKYKHFVKMWPERTDPHKFVYEDVAIATYLMLMWESDAIEAGDVLRPQKFVDLGCGNGLLVHILNNEGHLGKGVDLRSRKVWEFYDEKTILEVNSLDPSSQTYPEADWLIGNHSDELTPWIPVIAARSSFNCKYFVLPCCFHDFYCKFQRASSNERQYRSYLDYVENIGKNCGFEVKEDVLRIPSTKRVCHIGKNRTYPVEDGICVEDEILSMLKNSRHGHVSETRNLDDPATDKHYQIHAGGVIASSSCHHDNTEIDQSQERQFVPRSSTEPVKNCTKIDQKVLDEIVHKVASELLSRSQSEGVGECNVGSWETNKNWNRGGCMKLSEVSELFDQNVLAMLRCEAGGVKTVLRNSHQVFRVQGGVVEMRDWRQDSHCKETKKQSKTQKYWKTKHCWFHNHHPDGCPLDNELCSFAHGAEELRTV